MRKPTRVIQVNRGVAAFIVATMFGFSAALFAGYVDLRQLQFSDQRSDYRICIGAVNRIQDVVNDLLQEIPIPEDASPTARKALEERNIRAKESAERTVHILEESKAECELYLTRPPLNKEIK